RDRRAPGAGKHRAGSHAGATTAAAGAGVLKGCEQVTSGEKEVGLGSAQVYPGAPRPFEALILGLLAWRRLGEGRHLGPVVRVVR
ncbi:MAG: hypothetical protein OSB57_15135, partial [Planctomycetota bacterium]|nr:hypothetical protein [Planctomycetota bacterium]